MIKVKRVYEQPSRTDGLRVLVDRLWPRFNQTACGSKDLGEGPAPSSELRKWFAHDATKWKQFQRRYRKELRNKKDTLELLRKKSTERTMTLLYGARDEKHNEAVVLKKVLEGRR